MSFLLWTCCDQGCVFTGTLAGLFNQILTGEDLVRDRSIKFLANKYKLLGPEIITKDAEDLVIAETKKVLQVIN